MLKACCQSKALLRCIVAAAFIIGVFSPLSATARELDGSHGPTPLAPAVDPPSLSPLTSADHSTGGFSALSSFRLGRDEGTLDAAYPKYVVEPVVGFARDLARDYSTQFVFPFQFARRDPVDFLIGVAGLATLIVTDEATYDLLVPDDISEDDGLYKAAEKITKLADAGSSFPLVLGFFAVGVVAHSRREQETGVMLCEALVTSATWTELLKKTTGRERPRETGGEASDWTGPGGMFDDEAASDPEPRSFPSGHATGIWAVATIVAHQYSGHRVVPVLAYGTATAVCYSRMVVGAHWLSDVVVGGLIGYGCAKQVLSAHNDKRARSEDEGIHVGAYVSGGDKGISLRYNF